MKGPRRSVSGSNMAEERDTGQQGGPGGPHTPRGQRGRPAPRPASHRTARTAPPGPRGPFRNHLRSRWSGRLPPPSARRRKPCEVTERRAGRQTPREKPGRERRGGSGRPALPAGRSRLVPRGERRKRSTVWLAVLAERELGDRDGDGRGVPAVLSGLLSRVLCR